MLIKCEKQVEVPGPRRSNLEFETCGVEFEGVGVFADDMRRAWVDGWAIYPGRSSGGGGSRILCPLHSGRASSWAKTVRQAARP